MPSRHSPRSTAGAGAKAASERTSPAQGQHPAPRLPHEHDQSADSQQGAEHTGAEVGRQAHADVQRGLVDTDRAPQTDKLYRERLRADQDPPRR